MQVDVEKMLSKLKKTAREFGLEFGERPMTFNSRRAQELGMWAESLGRGHAFHMTAFRAYFANGQNLYDMAVLTDLARESGLDPDEARSVIEDKLFSDAVDADWEMARKSGIMAAPTFICGLGRLVGAQPYPALKRLVEGGITAG